MKKRWLLKLGLLACLGLGGFWFVAWWTSPHHRISQSGAGQIRAGMTLEDVLAIVRVPPGNYTTAALSQEGYVRMFLMQLDTGGRRVKLVERRWDYWFCDSGGLMVCFEDGMVSSSYFTRFPSTFLDKLRGWLRIR